MMCIKQFGDCHNQKNYIKNCRCVGMRVLAIPVFLVQDPKVLLIPEPKQIKILAIIYYFTCSQLFQRRRIVQIHK